MITKTQKITALLCVLALAANPLAAIKPTQPAPAQNPITAEAKKAPDHNQAAAKPGNTKPAIKQGGIAQADSALTSQLANPAINLSEGAVKKENRILTKNGQVYPIRQYKTLLNPNDPSANQWWVAPNGMNAVWDIPFGPRQTKIAIIDTGFALAHQEFTGRWAINAGESGSLSSNGLDDDGNGLVDDWRGWDFSTSGNDNSAQAGETNPNGSGTTHGTMVAGVLGATGNNGVGLAGVNWYSSILPIQALDDDGYGDTFTVGEAIYYAADQGADVISISLGTEFEDSYLRLAIQYAMSKGSIVVAAAGNDGCNCISYPANYPEVIAVGAVDSTNNLASFSSYGTRLDLLAPGANIATSTWSAGNPAANYAGNVAGTSFSTPFVAGLLGLARSYQPDAAWEEIVGTMLENSDRRALTAASPRSNTLGFGVSRANTMLGRLSTSSQPIIRYQFGGGYVFGSTRTYQCDGTLPASMFFELSRPNQINYTASPYENYKAVQQGWISREAFYSCIGLPTDLPNSLRVINLPAETKNIYLKP